MRFLVVPLADPEVGGVGGDFRYADPDSKGASERIYWSFDRWLKTQQSQGGSMTSATGQIYALRRNLFSPIPGDVTDDFFISTNAMEAKKRLVFEPRALGFSPVADSADEFRRKARVSTAGLTGVWHRRRLLNAFSYGVYALQLFSHKVMRRMVAFALVFLLLSSPILWLGSTTGWLRRFFMLATLGQVALHGAALVAIPFRCTNLGRIKLLNLPFYFDMVNL